MPNALRTWSFNEGTYLGLKERNLVDANPLVMVKTANVPLKTNCKWLYVIGKLNEFLKKERQWEFKRTAYREILCLSLWSFGQMKSYKQSRSLKYCYWTKSNPCTLCPKVAKPSPCTGTYKTRSVMSEDRKKITG